MKILVTGSAQGIGAAVAEKFLKMGHTVVGMDVLPAPFTHANYTHVLHNVADEPLPTIGGVEVLINNAGIQSQTDEDIRVNLTATIRLTEKYAFQPSIRAVVNVASSSATTGAEFPEYAASKGGLLAYTKNLANRLAPYGATCNSVSPGGVLSPLNEHIMQDETLYNAVLDETLLHKWATTEEIAEWIYFIAVVNRSMTGQDVLIDNGESVKFNFIW